MKKYIYTMMLILTSMNLAQAQRMIPGQKGFEVNAGSFSGDSPWRNYCLSMGMTVNGRKGSYQIWALEYSHLYSQYNDMHIPLETYNAEGGYSLFLLGDANKNIALNATLTGILGYENINRGEAMLYDGSKILNEDSFIYGAGGRLSFETYLSDHLVLLLQGRIRVLWGTDLKQFRPSAGLGLRYNF